MAARRRWARPPLEWVLATALGLSCWIGMQWAAAHPEVSEGRARRIAQRHADETLAGVSGTQVPDGDQTVWSFETDRARGGKVRYLVGLDGGFVGYECRDLPPPGPAIDESEAVRRAIAEASRHCGRGVSRLTWRVRARSGEWRVFTVPPGAGTGVWALLRTPLVSVSLSRDGEPRYYSHPTSFRGVLCLLGYLGGPPVAIVLAFAVGGLRAVVRRRRERAAAVPRT